VAEPQVDGIVSRGDVEQDLRSLPVGGPPAELRAIGYRLLVGPGGGTDAGFSAFCTNQRSFSMVFVMLMYPFLTWCWNVVLFCFTKDLVSAYREGSDAGQPDVYPNVIQLPQSRS
jgi:hypothetical protein